MASLVLLVSEIGEGENAVDGTKQQKTCRTKRQNRLFDLAFGPFIGFECSFCFLVAPGWCDGTRYCPLWQRSNQNNGEFVFVLVGFIAWHLIDRLQSVCLRTKRGNAKRVAPPDIGQTFINSAG